MKTRTLFMLTVLISGFGLLPAARVTAQTFTTLHSFTQPDDAYNTNTDGVEPHDGLIVSGNTLYGVALGGGTIGGGTVFAVGIDGTGFTTLHSFTQPEGPSNTNSDGGFPNGGLILLGNALYGTAPVGGRFGYGTVFKVNTDGTGFTNLHTFEEANDGIAPGGGLVSFGNTLYGTTMHGGISGSGVLFAVNIDGTGFTNLHRFTSPVFPYYTNSDGVSPNPGLIISGNTLYGTANRGGNFGNGTVFKVNIDGTGFTTLHSFTPPFYTNADGSAPNGNLTLLDSTLYGTAYEGGSSGNGTVFSVNTDGSGFRTLHSFSKIDATYATNSDGTYPQSGLLLSGNTLYGTASAGGYSRNGTVFALNTDGTGFTNLHNFSKSLARYATNSDGAFPDGGLILLGNALYGTAQYGGSSGNGTVFRLSFIPRLTITPSGTDIILSWPSGFDYTGYVLQSAPALTATFTNIPAATSPYTNHATGSQQYFRLLGTNVPPSNSVLFSKNFIQGDGGFTVVTPIPYDGPWVYESSFGSGSWRQNGQAVEDSQANTSLLNSPAIDISKSGAVKLTFAHRYSFEQGGWDGGQVRVSLNGGAFTAVPAAAFSENGYTGEVRATSRSDLRGQAAFVQDSLNFLSGTITSTCTLGNYQAGDSIRVQFMAASDTNTRGNFLPNWEIDSVEVIAVGQ